ncbi:MAG: tRNA uracil 4-sulfurtransferase ThiI [Bacilli bacterium]|jgi:thiamine biosynthesis protein ThiI
MDRKIMIHYGELTTKGKNRANFINQLYRNINHALKKHETKIERTHDHIYIDYALEDEEKIISRLQEISGIHAISVIYVVENDLDTLKATALEIMNSVKGKTFKVQTKRIDKTYPLISDKINRELASVILKNTNWKVDVHNYDFLLKVQIRPQFAHFFAKTYPGSGGYPLGISAKSLLLLSGGIDSPVAAYKMLRRGMKLEFIHFASPPYTKRSVINKVTSLLQTLTPYQHELKLHIIDFKEIQEAIYANVPEPYCITIMRRMMFRISSLLARRVNAKALVTGESLGQVASQTLESIQVINEVTNMPVIRPLATDDKVDIIHLAQSIGTYDISILPYEDCCTIFTPINPTTKPKLSKCLEYEAKFPYEEMIIKAIKERETLLITDEEVKTIKKASS